ncbi:hypothetical protein Cantr_00513 [Candida viswanathii]|uniref:Uncharacterized protein n=1 Tax=Candida viswanathii TaxID=5486 RepID=A0A367YGF4_9ASCO|nr:hypothetical protein Cantr_00513 [Candida viswanathii]
MESNIHQELHQIELTAHTLLSGSFDSLNENFESLNQSQSILLTRLKVIENKLNEFQKFANDGFINEKELAEQFHKIKELRKRLDSCLKTIEKVEKRLDSLE